MSDRVIVYIDGFNLYFAMKDLNWQKYYWLDLHRLAMRLIKKDQNLINVKYFTSRLSTISSSSEKAKRQNTYLDALDIIGGIHIIYGNYESKEWSCPKCNKKSFVPHEKRTDVNIATEIIMDAFYDRYDTAILISTDSDLVAPVQAVARGFDSKKIVIAFPPKRYSKGLDEASEGFIFINKSQLSNCQLPIEILTKNGFVIKRPEHWN